MSEDGIIQGIALDVESCEITTDPSEREKVGNIFKSLDYCQSYVDEKKLQEGVNDSNYGKEIYLLKVEGLAHFKDGHFCNFSLTVRLLHTENRGYTTISLHEDNLLEVTNTEHRFSVSNERLSTIQSYFSNGENRIMNQAVDQTMSVKNFLDHCIEIGERKAQNDKAEYIIARHVRKVEIDNETLVDLHISIPEQNTQIFYLFLKGKITLVNSLRIPFSLTSVCFINPVSHALEWFPGKLGGFSVSNIDKKIAQRQIQRFDLKDVSPDFLIEKFFGCSIDREAYKTCRHQVTLHPSNHVVTPVQLKQWMLWNLFKRQSEHQFKFDIDHESMTIERECSHPWKIYSRFTGKDEQETLFCKIKGAITDLDGLKHQFTLVKTIVHKESSGFSSFHDLNGRTFQILWEDDAPVEISDTSRDYHRYLSAVLSLPETWVFSSGGFKIGTVSIMHDLLEKDVIEFIKEEKAGYVGMQQISRLILNTLKPSLQNIESANGTALYRCAFHGEVLLVNGEHAKYQLITHARKTELDGQQNWELVPTSEYANKIFSIDFLDTPLSYNELGDINLQNLLTLLFNQQEDLFWVGNAGPYELSVSIEDQSKAFLMSYLREAIIKELNKLLDPSLTLSGLS